MFGSNRRGRRSERYRARRSDSRERRRFSAHCGALLDQPGGRGRRMTSGREVERDGKTNSGLVTFPPSPGKAGGFLRSDGCALTTANSALYRYPCFGRMPRPKLRERQAVMGSSIHTNLRLVSPSTPPDACPLSASAFDPSLPWWVGLKLATNRGLLREALPKACGMNRARRRP